MSVVYGEFLHLWSLGKPLIRLGITVYADTRCSVAFILASATLAGAVSYPIQNCNCLLY